MTHPISLKVRKQVYEALQYIESQHNVKIIYACESGSRAWGFASADSDYDVRFIYLHPPEWYFAIDIEHRRDVIELPIDDDLDIGGWDLRKTLQLFQRSNSPLWEWLGSPIIYQEKFSVIEKMRQLADTCYSPLACQYHYLKMAQGNNPENKAEGQATLKKYLYTLRPLLAVMWLEKQLGVVPTEFQKLVDGVVTDLSLQEAIAKLVAMKKAGGEKETRDVPSEIITFLQTQLARLESEKFAKRVSNCSCEQLNNLFRQALQEVWSIRV